MATGRLEGRIDPSILSKAKETASKRGFKSFTAYVRYLLVKDSRELASEFCDNLGSDPKKEEVR